jgi:hypothetical protein
METLIHSVSEWAILAAVLCFRPTRRFVIGLLFIAIAITACIRLHHLVKECRWGGVLPMRSVQIATGDPERRVNS